MRKFLMTLIALMTVIASGATVATAQQATPGPETASSGAPVALAEGFDAPATYFSDRGDAITTITVLDVERGWQDYGRYYDPDPGVEYVAVTFAVENLSRGNIIVKPYDFSMLDAFGRNNSRSYVSVDEDSGARIFEEDTTVASGEAVELVIIFALYEQTEIAMFMWQPDSGIIVMVDLRDA
jgi:hypothetical protein